LGTEKANNFKLTDFLPRAN